jgi:hypothetical protein
MRIACLLLIAAVTAPVAPAQIRQGNLKAGDVAPDFNLKVRAADRYLKLSDLRGKKPVALMFGSFT